MISLLEASRAGLFRWGQWLPNIVVGAIVGVVALPLSLAFAIASGVRPEQGIYTSIIAGLLVSASGGSRVQIAGPTGAFVVILAGVIEGPFFFGAVDSLERALAAARAVVLRLGPKRRYYSTLAQAVAHSGGA